MAQKFNPSGAMFKPISGSALNIEWSRLFGTYLEFRCSDLSDSSWRRILSTLASKEYKEPVSNMELRLLKMGILDYS